MNEQITNYLNSQRIGVLAVEMLDGSPHGATVHFAHTDNPFTILVLTDRAYKKCEPLVAKGKTRATFVVGTNEEEMKTMQMDGTLEFAKENSQADYFKKFPNKQESFEPPDDVLLVFTPAWWRFTDFKTPQGKQVITSD